MSKIFETASYKLAHTELEHEFGMFEDSDIAIKLTTADSRGFVLTISDMGWSGKTLTFTLDTCMQQGTWDLEVENNE